MATLTSPGVSISVTDESFYAAAGTGTVPLIVIATAQDKSAPDGSGTAKYTTKASAGNVYLVNSQRDLLTTYGNPVFKSSGGTPLHGHELNEYGLQAAYSFLGIANRAYVLRADIDLNQLAGSNTAPSSAPADGQHWQDISGQSWGLKEWSGSAWVKQSVLRPTKDQVTAGSEPKASIGVDGQFAVVYQNASGVTLADIKFYEKISGAWYEIGTSGWDTASSGDFQIARHTNVPSQRSGGGNLVAGDLYLQMNALNQGTISYLKVYSASNKAFANVALSTRQYEYQAVADYVTPKVGDLWAKYSAETAKVNYLRHNGGTTLTAASSAALTDTAVSVASHTAGTVGLIIQVNDRHIVNGSNGNIAVTFNGFDSDADGNLSVDDMVQAINSALSAANNANTDADKLSASNVSGKVTIVNSAGTNMNILAGNVGGFSPSTLNLQEAYSNFEALSFISSESQPTGTLATGTLWYDNLISNSRIDILYKDSSSAWATYPYDVNVSASAPMVQSDGVSALVTGDLWIGSGDLENYPKIYKYNSALAAGSRWVLLDNADQTSGDGVLFADFRASASSSLDTDAPNPSLYPLDILGWNKRASGGNVKQWDGSKWVDYSGNKADGSPKMLRKAQRAAVVKAMQASVASNQDIRNETNRFNLISCPGYAELLDEMITLNTDRKETAFVIGDAPLRLAPDSSSTQAWASNSGNATENGEDGLVSKYAYSAVYYPHGVSTNLDGSSIVIPSSSIALRTFAYNDQVAFPWFAPAGFQRGVVTNASSVGYIDSASGEFKAVSLNEGQRDSLYSNKINPIANFPARGVNVFGQKTLNANTSALDRVNVARLVVYIRERLDDIVKPFLFEPNDAAVRADAKAIVDRFLANLVTQRGLFDFVTVCDTSNNTAERIDRNELHIDIAIQPVKSIEFIYIPIRVQNTLGQVG